MPSSTIAGAPLARRTIVLFWLPLAATWFMMAAEGPYIAAIVARMPEAAVNLAAYGVATSLAWLVESPIMMLLSASTALVRDRPSYLALRRFTSWLNAAVTIAMALLAVPPVFRFVGERLIGLPPEISLLAQHSTAILILWPASIGYRRFYQGLLVRRGFTRRVAYGTVVRLVTMSLMAALLALTGWMHGAGLGALALLSGVIAEAAASRWMARHVVRSLKESDEIASGTLTGFSKIARFYYPLALTSVLSMALGPLVTFGLGRGRAPLESLAVWPVVIALVFLFRSGGVAFQEVGIALAGSRGEHAPELRRTAGWLAAIATMAIAVVALTPLQAFWFERVSGLAHDLAAFAVWPLRLMILLPATEYLLSIQRGRRILAHRTGVLTAATAIEAGGLAVALLVTIGPLQMIGAIGGAIALLAGRVAANAYLARE